MKLKVTVNGVPYQIEVEVEEEQPAPLAALVVGRGGGGSASIPTKASMPAAPANGVVAPLAGSVSKILVADGDTIETGQVLLVLEAMKMETEITAPSAGTITAIFVAPGDAVQGGQPLIELA